MNKTISIIRIAVLFVIFSFGMLFLFGEEHGDSAWTLIQIITDKALALGAFYLVGKLYKRWSKIDQFLITYDKMCNEVMDGEDE
ncbi:MAG: hypothetical protein NC344_05785 [Bacteroidales bacterium]|nr:hypothetical protein [Bacteroidales bacterium]MCM1147330.1 hypothetical protein [Bacteroidales bacterium]MCM1206236.1 hypothetical protein [Bacillota bacterium]